MQEIWLSDKFERDQSVPISLYLRREKIIKTLVRLPDYLLD